MTPKSTRVIKILDAIVVKSEALIETAKAIDAVEARDLAAAIANTTASCHLRLTAATKVSSPSFTITGIEFSIDGTNFATLCTFASAVTIDAAGEKVLSPVNASVADFRTTKLRLVMGSSAPDGSNYITLTAEVVIFIP